ncbi:accessory gland protein Acp63F [Drosophila subpulchrella]|uniref:accessory gland protein Acp63F n=1 Tax=Drosophila subpulchrella TaxID=1486046 RepID=UPI0018A19E16|nr:accessory gland protein Acp63F [Drosophila subpulchrella]
MKSFSIAFILVFLILQVQGKCNLPIPEYLHPLCGIARECVFDGGNEVDITNQSCRRREQGKPPFLKIENGYCESNQTQCPRYP